jgi:UDP-N-acetylmuramate--alanine ligase
MCGAAELLLARGLEVRGSDRAPTRRTERLGRLGVRVDADLHAASIPEGTTLVVTSAAVAPDHPQLVEAARRGLPVWKYAEVLGALMQGRTGVAVAGCHGKTTTSALVATALWRAGRDPSFVVGGEVLDLATSARPGRGPHFVVEACEFDRSFHRLSPTVAVVTNVDVDHLDYYRDLEEIRDSFRAFARLLPPEGRLVVHEDHAAVFRGAGVVAPVETYGFGPRADWRAQDAWWDGGDDLQRFRVAREGRLEGLVRLPLSGQHNVLNATGAIAALCAAGLSFEEAAAGLASFGGVGRRLERVVEARGVLVLDDYGHHPVEIRAVVRALRSRHPGRRLVVVFQPHQASRTHLLLDDFAAALAEADEAWVAPIYLARDSEEDRRRVAAADVALRTVHAGGKATAFLDLASIVEHAVGALREGDVVVTMGAGDVDEVAHGLRDRLR